MKEINPFVVNNPIEVIRLDVKSRFTNNKDINDGIKYSADTLNSNYLVDKQKKITVYSHPFYSIDNILFGSLNSKARDLYLYIIYHLKENTDYISLKLCDVKKTTGISRNSIVAAIKDLKAVGIIAPKSQSIYWVNPMYIFRGNRIEYYRNIKEELIDVVSTVHKI